jgi:EmrB/QacA subfamily drug resistance transporter
MSISSDRLSPALPQQEIPLKPIFLGLMLVILLAALEQTIVAVALPVIASRLQGFNLMAWVVSAYLVAATVVTPIYGKLSDIYGRRTVLSSAIVIFVLASAGCALAQTMPQLILMRVLQGLGGGGLISVAQATIADVVPLRDRGRYQGYISGVWVIASMAGPVIGGYLTHYLSWPWIFWLNLPVGLIALIMLRRSLRHLPVIHAKRKIDYVGAVLFATGLTALLIAITRIGQGVALSNTVNLLLLVGAALVLILFGWYENRTAEPIIPLGILRNRTVLICCIALFLSFFQLISMSVLLPLHLQMIGAVSADLAALRLLPLTLSIPFGSFLAGRLMSANGHYKSLLFLGSLAASLASFALAFTQPEQVWLMIAVMVVIGLGIGCQLPTALVATQNAVPPSQVGLATALSAFSRLLGGAVGVAVLSSILIALLRNTVPSEAIPAAGGEVLMDLFHAIMNSAADSSGNALRDTAEGAFRNLFIISAAISLITPAVVFGLRESNLRAAKNADAAVE